VDCAKCASSYERCCNDTSKLCGGFSVDEQFLVGWHVGEAPYVFTILRPAHVLWMDQISHLESAGQWTSMVHIPFRESLIGILEIPGLIAPVSASYC